MPKSERSQKLLKLLFAADFVFPCLFLLPLLGNKSKVKPSFLNSSSGTAVNGLNIPLLVIVLDFNTQNLDENVSSLRPNPPLVCAG